MFQLFSNESLALKMVDQLKLLHVMVIALKYMMSKILIQNTLHGKYIMFINFIINFRICFMEFFTKYIYFRIIIII